MSLDIQAKLIKTKNKTLHLSHTGNTLNETADGMSITQRKLLKSYNK